MISSIPSAATLGVPNEARPPAGLKPLDTGAEDKPVAEAKRLKEAYTQFVGEAFYGQMLKAMRTTVGEPAYFHGGTAERQFQTQLDAKMAQDLASDGGSGLADELFESQFPNETKLLREAASSEALPSLSDLDDLRRR